MFYRFLYIRAEFFSIRRARFVHNHKQFLFNVRRLYSHTDGDFLIRQSKRRQTAHFTLSYRKCV
ncbi:MAG: hypothetical protein IJZ32_00890 [Clostridia bacterium]|nr:hypothetical protein [Clostridia bacterium]